MGRSVSVPSDAQVVTYVDISYMDDQMEFDMYLEDLINQLMNKLPSLYKSDEWLGRENKVLLENDLCYIGCSTYGNLMSLWVVVKYDYANIAFSWVYTNLSDTICSMGDLQKEGTMSNGVSIYTKKAGDV